MSDSYNVRVSTRARYVYLRFSRQRGLEVVVPRGYDVANIPPLLERKRKWIERIRLKFEKQEPFLPPPVEKFPTTLSLAAVNETLSITYIPTPSRSVQLKEEGQTLTLSGCTESEIACKRVLRRWLCRRGADTLVPWLREVSAETNLPFERASVRLQKSRWGSCSRKKTISINAKLLFLRPELVRYLFIHELCHLVHMNHSPRYWNFVSIKEPNYKALDREMRNAMRTIPQWV